jgi:hypothetical protein
LGVCHYNCLNHSWYGGMHHDDTCKRISMWNHLSHNPWWYVYPQTLQIARVKLTAYQ